MKLRDYLEASGLTMTAFGEKVGVSHAAISRYCDGSRHPSMRVMQEIARATKGDVTPNDFMAEAA